MNKRAISERSVIDTVSLGNQDGKHCKVCRFNILLVEIGNQKVSSAVSEIWGISPLHSPEMNRKQDLQRDSRHSVSHIFISRMVNTASGQQIPMISIL